MTINLFQTPEYKEIIQTHIFQTIEYMFAKNQEFAIACEVPNITFLPELPQEIMNSFNEKVLFILSGYTLDSATINKEFCSFEAGFGDENFGSTVTVPLLAIKQLFVGDNPIIFNLANYEKKEELKKASAKSSMEALLNNPENKKLLKKKRSDS